MGRNSNVAGGEDSLKSGWLTKRSQLKTRFAAFATNYKDRWFVLTRVALIYYDSQDPSRLKERGRLPLTGFYYRPATITTVVRYRI